MTYWDMACSFVNHGAIDVEMFNDANSEQVFVFAKLQPFIEQIRANNGNPNAFRHLEQAVMAMPQRRGAPRPRARDVEAHRAGARRRRRRSRRRPTRRTLKSREP